MKPLDGVQGVIEVLARVPGLVLIMEPGPLYSILQLVLMVS
jgi:hypothetical protein